MKRESTPADTKLFPPKKVKCKYCNCIFMTKGTYNGSKQKFCKPSHRKAYHDEGSKPIDVILKRQEKRLREIAREEALKVVAEVGTAANPAKGVTMRG